MLIASLVGALHRSLAELDGLAEVLRRSTEAPLPEGVRERGLPGRLGIRGAVDQPAQDRDRVLDVLRPAAAKALHVSEREGMLVDLPGTADVVHERVAREQVMVDRALQQLR